MKFSRLIVAALAGLLTVGAVAPALADSDHDRARDRWQARHNIADRDRSKNHSWRGNGWHGTWQNRADWQNRGNSAKRLNPDWRRDRWQAANNLPDSDRGRRDRDRSSHDR